MFGVPKAFDGFPNDRLKGEAQGKDGVLNSKERAGWRSGLRLGWLACSGSMRAGCCKEHG